MKNMICDMCGGKVEKGIVLFDRNRRSRAAVRR